MAFEPIETQEQLDKVIGERLKQNREKVENELKEKYGDYDALKSTNAEHEKTISELKDSLKEKEGKITELNGKVHKYETDSVKTRVAQEAGLPAGMAARLTGETEEELKKDAESLSKLIGKQGNPAPPFIPDPQNDPGQKDTAKKAAIKSMLSSMKGE